jgi:adenine-specific DNA-methyltransferase
MSKVFVGGSRRISRLNVELRNRLEQIVEKQLAILVGDANGSDKAIQNFFRENGYRNVVVFCTEGHCRNNLGQWPIRPIKPPHHTRDFEYFTAKDAAMAREADYGLMLWDGASAGTLVNVARLVALRRPVVVYVSPQRRFLTLKSREDLAALLASCPTPVRTRVRGYIAHHAPEFAQPSMFHTG